MTSAIVSHMVKGKNYLVPSLLFLKKTKFMLIVGMSMPCCYQQAR